MKRALPLILALLGTSAGATPIHVTGWETWDAGPASEVGSPTYSGTFARSERVGMEIAAAADTQVAWFVDLTPYTAEVDLVGYRVYFDADNVTLGIGESAVMTYVGQGSGGTTPGCVAVLGDAGSGLEVSILYLGTLDAPVEMGTVAVGADWQDIGIFQQNETASRVTCALVSGNGQPRFSVTQDLPGGKSTEDIHAIYLGTSGSSLLPADAITVRFDDLSIDDEVVPGPGRALVITGIGDSNAQWTSKPSNCADEPNPDGCVDDWLTGPANSCSDTDFGNWRERNTGIREDIFQMSDITLGSGETISAIAAVARACNNHGGGGIGRMHHRIEVSGTDFDGADVDIADGALVWIYDDWLTNPVTTNPWTDSDIDFLLAGYNKPTDTAPQNGKPGVTAFLIYIDTRTAVALPDVTLLDLRPDGVRVLGSSGNSISAGTGAGLCENPCTPACTTDADCSAYASSVSPELEPPACLGGFCQVPCGSSADCDNCPGGEGGVCPAAKQYTNRVCSQTNLLDTCWNCARSGSTTEDIVADTLACVDDPRQCGLCTLIKGDAGTCSVTTGTICKTDGDCPGGEICEGYPLDYVTIIGGTNNSSGLGPAPCEWTISNSVGFVSTLGYNERTCPLAEVGAAGYACERVGCTTDSTCVTAYGTGSKCRGACVGHTDPVWPCFTNGNCGACSDDSDRPCSALPVTCTDSGGSVTCTPGACDLGTKFCTCPSSSVSCSVDSDCGVGDMHGVCLGGTCALSGVDGSLRINPKICVGGVSDGADCSYGSDCSGGKCLVDPKFTEVWRRRKYKLGHDADDILAQMIALTAAVEAKGSRLITLTNITQTSDPGVGTRSTRIITQELRRRQLELPDSLDMLWYFRNGDNRNIEDSIFGPGKRDKWHPKDLGGGLMADPVLAMLRDLMGVCSDDHSIPCQYCEVGCTATPECGGGGATCVSGTCRCASDADCGSGSCEDVGSGVMKCVSLTMDDCPAGAGLVARDMPPTDEVCPAGTCSEQYSGPRCTRTLNRCATTADCDGFALGDICALDAAWINCSYDGQCRLGGPWADDICGTEGLCERPSP